jgi:hypothetical protein
MSRHVSLTLFFQNWRHFPICNDLFFYKFQTDLLEKSK